MPSRFEFNARNMEKYFRLLKSRINLVKCDVASAAYEYLVNFNYNWEGGAEPPLSVSPEDKAAQRTFYVNANWNISVNTVDRSTPPSQREFWYEPPEWPNPSRGSVYPEHFAEFYGDIDFEKAVTVYEKSEPGDSITVTNSLEYASWLDEGRVLAGNAEIRPNHFIKKCSEVIERKVRESSYAVSFDI